MFELLLRNCRCTNGIRESGACWSCGGCWCARWWCVVAGLRKVHAHVAICCRLMVQLQDLWCASFLVRGGDNVKDSQVQQLEWMTVVASYAGTWRMRCGEDGSCANGCTNISVAAIVSLRIEDDSRWCLQPWWPEV